jgi:DedD protein
MDRQLLERMIGAVVLLVAFVLIVPAILDGGDNAGTPAPEPANATVAAEPPTRQYEIRLDRPAESPPIPQPAIRDIEPAAGPVDAGESESRDTSTVVPSSAPKPAAEPKVAKAPTVKRPASLDAGWIVQLGSFSSRQNAQGLANRVRAQGFDSYLMPVARSGKTLYRVRVGPPREGRDDAVRLAEDLRKAGFAGQIAEQSAGG